MAGESVGVANAGSDEANEHLARARLIELESLQLEWLDLRLDNRRRDLGRHRCNLSLRTDRSAARCGSSPTGSR